MTDKEPSVLIVFSKDIAHKMTGQQSLAAQVASAGLQCDIRWLEIDIEFSTVKSATAPIFAADFLVFSLSLDVWRRAIAYFPMPNIFSIEGRLRPCRLFAIVDSKKRSVEQFEAKQLSFHALQIPTLAAGEGYFNRRLQREILRSFGVNEIKLSKPDNYASSSAQSAGGWSARPIHQLASADTRKKLNCYDVWFATNRKILTDGTRRFSGSRGDRLHFGICRVSVPRSHRIGQIRGSWLRRALRFRFDDPELAIRDVSILPEDGFWLAAKENLLSWESTERVALLYIHGYNVGFDESVLRAAQIGYDLKIALTALFSWPSAGKLAAYSGDEATIEASEYFLEDFLGKLSACEGVTRLHVIAHSMGNRALLGALERMANRLIGSTNVPFGQIILAAPDVDADSFKNATVAHAKLRERTTIYIGSKDKALKASKFMHWNYPRAGYAPPITILPCADTIDSTHVDFTTLGHGYVAQVRAILHDIFVLIRHGTPPSARFGLQSATDETGSEYWRFARD